MDLLRTARNLLADLSDPLTSRVGYVSDPALTTTPTVWVSAFGMTLWVTLPEVFVTPSALDKEPVKTFEVRNG